MTIIDAYNQTDYLDTVSMIGGSYKELEFHFQDSAGNPILTGGALLKWFLSPYGQPDICVLEKEGNYIENGKFAVILDYADTYFLGGTYVQQIEITDVDGKYFRPAQGIVIIRKAIQNINL